jgi:hypothetical protein
VDIRGDEVEAGKFRGLGLRCGCGDRATEATAVDMMRISEVFPTRKENVGSPAKCQMPDARCQSQMPEVKEKKQRSRGGKYQVQMFQSKEGDQFAVASPPKVPDT